VSVPVERPGSSERFVASPCAVDLDLYLHPLLEDPPARSTASKQVWAEYEGLVARARALCAGCPLLADCLYKAVVQTDVAGYVGCTTPLERRAIRRRVGIALPAEDLDAYAGTRGERQPVEHEDVLRMRAAHPDDSLETLAERLGCSLSTVKRHLRRARREGSEESAGGDREVVVPTMDEVFEAFEAVVEQR
jgi:transcription factor WhiB/sigma-70-like protein